MRLGRTVRTLKRRMAFTRGQHRGRHDGFLQPLQRGFTHRTDPHRLMGQTLQLRYGRSRDWLSEEAPFQQAEPRAQRRPPAPRRDDATPTADTAFVDDTEAGAVHLAPDHPVSAPPTVEGMPGGALPMGRIPVSDVRPLVDGGTRPAKSVVGEEFTVRAKVFREGHDAVNATAVLTDPDGTDHYFAMHSVNPGLSEWSATVVADREGWWTYRVEGWSDPYATWVHDAGIKIAAGVDEDLMCAEGVRVLERFAAAVRGLGVDASEIDKGVVALGDNRAPAAHRFGAATSPEIAGPRRARAAARVRVGLTGILPARRARARALRRLVRDLPPLRGRAPRREDRRVGLRHLPVRGRAAARDRRHGLRRRLPDADPPDRHDRPQGPQQLPHRPARRPRIPLRHRLARRRARRDPPRPRHVRGLRPLRRRGAPRSAWRWRSTSRCRPPPTTRGCRRTPTSSRRGPTAPSPTPRTRRRSTRTSTRSTSTTTPPGPTPRCAGSSRCGSTTACASSASTTPTPSRSPSGSG